MMVEDIQFAVTPVPEAGSEFEKCIFKAFDAGLKVLMYGSTKYASEKLRELIGVKLSYGISG